MSILKIKNKTAIITGASEGIGKSLAVHFAKRGFALGLIARRSELLQSVALECIKSGASKVEIVAVDITNFLAFRTAIDSLEKKIGECEIFIANAGVSGRSRFKKDNHENAIQVLKVNLIAAIEGIEFMKEKMVKRGGGSIVGVSSVAAARGFPTSGTYSTSKAALTNYLEGLEIELYSSNVKVITVAPGFIDTSMTKGLRGKVPFMLGLDAAGEKFVKHIINGKRFIIEPKPFILVYVLCKIMPDFIFRQIMFMILKFYKLRSDE